MHIFLTFYVLWRCALSWCVNYVCNDLSGLNLRFCFVFYISFAIRLELVCGIVKIDLLQFVFLHFFLYKTYVYKRLLINFILRFIVQA